MNTYEERRTKFFADKLELHKKTLKVVDKLCCCDEKTKNELHSEQKEIIQYISEAQQAFKENRELKKLLETAIRDFQRVTKMCVGIQCDSCPHNYLRDCCEWQYKDEAMKLLKGEALQEFQPVVRCKNCKYYTDNINDPNLRKGFCNRIEMNCFDKRLPDDYCSYGEKIEIEGGD